MKRYWYADPHFNHANILRFCPNRKHVKEGDLDEKGKWVNQEIASARIAEHDRFLINRINSRIQEDDKVVMVGDFLFKGRERGIDGKRLKTDDVLNLLNGKYILVQGNHDDQNGVKTDCQFMTVEMGGYNIGVQHQPLYDENDSDNDRNQRLHESASEGYIKYLKGHAEYCRKTFEFIICGHVHQAWAEKKIAGIWHINVGVDVRDYYPISDNEVIGIYDRLIRGEK